MNTTNNYILITIDSEFEDKISGPEGILNLELATFKSNIVDRNDEVIYNANAHKKNNGTVIGIPAKLTEEIKMYQEPVGNPQPLRYIDSDMVRRIGVDYLQYECGVWEPTWKTAADIKMDVLAGDKVYFHYNTLEAENRLNFRDGRKVYKLAYQNVICVVRESTSIDMDMLMDYCTKASLDIVKELHKIKEGSSEITVDIMKEIIPIGGRVLIEPVYDEGVQDLGDGKMGKLSAGGLVVEIDNKPKYLEGIVRYISLLKGEETELAPGDTIIYQKNSDWLVNIEGKEYYCMRTIDIEGKILPE